MTIDIFVMCIICGLGALLRYYLTYFNRRFILPVGTLFANCLGCFIIGYLYHYFSEGTIYLILATGFCGGLTTYSTLNAELMTLYQKTSYFFSYFLLSYLLGFMCLFLGFII